jgi:hypothetical protein
MPAARARLGAVVAAVLAGLAGFEHVRMARMVARAVTNADVALMWFSAREFGAGHFRTPHVYGQAYGSNLEAIPIEVARRLGASLPQATVGTWALLAVGGWVLLALGAWRAGRRGLALAALAAPLVISAYYSFVVTTVATYQGAHFLVIAGAAALIARPRHSLVEAAGWAAMGLGVYLDASGAVLGVAVGIWALAAPPRDRRRLHTLPIGAAAAGVYAAWGWWFYRAHPDTRMFGDASLAPSSHTLADNVTKHLGRFFALFTPEIVDTWVAVLVLAGVLVALVCASGRVPHAAAALAVPAVVVVGMASPKSVGTLGPFLSPGRILATLPHALWFLAFLAADAGAVGRLRLRPAATVALAGLIALGLVSTGLRLGDYDDRVVALRARASRSVYGFAVPMSGLVARCGTLRRAAARADATVVVFLTDKAAAYGCGALDYGRYDTLLPSVERRTWRLYAERRRTRRAALVQGAGPGYCGYAGPRVESCEVVAPGVVALRFAPQSLLGVLAELNVAVRAYGPDCSPKPFGLGAFLCPEGLVAPVVSTGPPPADAALARAEIAAAFAVAIDPGSGFTTVEAGGDVAARVAADPEGYAAALGPASVRVDGIRFLNAHQAFANLHVRGTGPPIEGRYRAWAIRREGRWLVDRNSFCLVEALATSQNRWCAPVAVEA